METLAPGSNAKLCKVCSKINMQRLTRPFYPCCGPLPCYTAPTGGRFGAFIALGSIDEIRSRRLTCDICKLILESLEKEPPDLNGECTMRETEEYCTFKLPGYVKARDPSITHFHLTQLSVTFHPSVEDEFQGPSLPWELEVRDARLSRYILNFQAKARCQTELEPNVTSQTEQEFLDAIGGRYVPTQISAQLIRAWLHHCENIHGKDCASSRRLSGDLDRKPIFVVDVTQSCLMETPSQCRYVALSYVWGTTPVFKHLLENTRDIQKTGSLLSLPIPATIRDAMDLVRSIGERYLWVDSLCIIQDDLMMQHAEIMRMGSIYSNAVFTIIAATGDHANYGLPGVRRASRERAQKILKLANSELLTVIDVRKTPSGIDDTIWASRAWTFQERVLSNRVLVFSESQVYWDCRAASHSEERALERVRDISRHHLSFPQKPSADFLHCEPLEPSEYPDIYSDMLSNYRQRRLAYQSDILNAFNGISEVLAALQNDTFLWGLPESLFTYAMTWTFTGHSVRNRVHIPVFDSNGSKEMIPIPSWSWAAWSGEDPNNPPFLHAGYSSHVRPVIRFDLVDGNHQPVRIKEWQGHPGDSVPTLWKSGNREPQPFRVPAQDSASRVGQLRFWTSLANLRVIRGQSTDGPGQMEYILFPSPDFRPDPNSTYYATEFVHQDFIVIAARDPKTLILLAVEWTDGVAYRVGKADVREEDWVHVGNRQWRFITLG